MSEVAEHNLPLMLMCGHALRVDAPRGAPVRYHLGAAIEHHDLRPSSVSFHDLRRRRLEVRPGVNHSASAYLVSRRSLLTLALEQVQRDE